MRIGTTGTFRSFTSSPTPARNGLHLAVGSVMTFGEDKNAIAAIDGFTGEGKAVTEAGLAWQRKDVQQRDAEEPFDAIEDSPKKKLRLAGGVRRASRASPPAAVASLCRRLAGSAARIKPTSTSPM